MAKEYTVGGRGFLDNLGKIYAIYKIGRAHV